ncbi:MAG: prolyl-tRNA synthetase associated domain-containing protein [Bacillota bacterium]|nr:prolyl-tRNA synthetase associated domain-containing protein [Bacillota bacterium]
MGNEKRVYEVLEDLGISYSVKEHPPVFTVEEAEEYWRDVPGTHCKNLFLRDQKGKRHYLVVLEHSKKVDMNNLAGQIGDGKLSFGSEGRLEKYLGLATGAVSPFGLINDSSKEVKVVLDEDLKKAELVNFHPNVNTATVTISYRDFEKFLQWCKNDLMYVNI